MCSHQSELEGIRNGRIFERPENNLQDLGCYFLLIRHSVSTDSIVGYTRRVCELATLCRRTQSSKLAHTLGVSNYAGMLTQKILYTRRGDIVQDVIK